MTPAIDDNTVPYGASQQIAADPSDKVETLSDASHNRVTDETAVLAEGEEKSSTFLLCLTFAAALSGFLFGYDTGVISGVLVLIKGDLGQTLGDVDKEWITSSLTVGALIGGLGGGVLADRFGRRKVLGVSDLFFILGAIIQAAANNLAAMCAGRLIMGFGVGVAAGIAPLFIGELAPTTKRGRLVTISETLTLFASLGYLVLKLSFLRRRGHHWRTGELVPGRLVR